MAKDFSGGPGPLKPVVDKPANTQFPAPSVPVVQPNQFGSSQSQDKTKPKIGPIVSGKKPSK